MVNYHFKLKGTRAVLIPQSRKKRRRFTIDRVVRHDWLAYPAQRKLLFFMDCYYQNDRDDITRIFNFAFSHELAEGRLAKRTLDAQIRDEGTKRVADIAEILNLPDKEVLPKLYSNIHKLIVDAAKALEIELVRKSATDRVVPSKTPMKRKERASTDSSNSDSSIDVSVHSTESEGEILSRATKRTTSSFHTTSPLASRTRPLTLAGGAEPLTPPQSETTVLHVSTKSAATSRQDRRLLPAIALTPPVTPSKNSSQTTSLQGIRRKPFPQMPGILSHDGVPFLLFRCWDETSHGQNSASGFSGGLATNESPMLETDPEFVRHAEAHLWTRPQPSPFISMTTSLPTALRKAAHKIAAGGSPVIAILDGRAIALKTRLYHARVVITTLREKNVRLPYYGSNGEYEYWVWQKTDAILGQLSLAQLQEWTQNDDCLGALLIQNDLGKMGVPAFRGRCRNALAINGNLGRSIRSLAMLFRPATSQHDPFLKDFVRIILQNLDLAENLQDWESNMAFTDGLFGLPEQNTTEFLPGAANDLQDGHRSGDDGFEDIDDVMPDSNDTTRREIGGAIATGKGFEIITIDDDDDHDFVGQPMTTGQRSGQHAGSSNASSKPRPQIRPREQEQALRTPLAHRTRASSISSDEGTVSLPPSPYDRFRADMRDAALQASPTPAPRPLPSAVEDLDDSTVPGSATRMPVPRVDCEAAMQEMLSIVPPAKRESWSSAFDMYVRGIVMDVMSEGRNI